MINRLRNIFTRLVATRVLQHLVFWALSFLVLTNILRVSAEIQRIDLIYALVFHIPIMLVVYFNQSVLFPHLLAKNKYALYVLAVLLTMAFGAEFYLQLFERWIDYLFPGYYFIAYYTFWDILLFLAVYLVLTTLIKLARGWFKLNLLEQEKTSNELKALRSQLNPHFLFNSLNNLYSLTRKKSDLAPAMVLKLSDVLRYVIYDAETSLISLRKELDFLNKYIEIQKLRLESDFRVQVDVQGDPGQLQIAPLLFLPFVENAFKHGVQSPDKPNKISIHWEINQSQVIFSVQNQIVPEAISEQEKYKGIGIANVKKRLELLYPEKHELYIQQDEKYFIVKLKIDLS
jgi:sensor histidine kinase YesM